MCIAIYLPKGKILSKDTLLKCNDSNPDGFGFAFFDNDKRLNILKEVDETKIEKHIKRFMYFRNKFIDKPFLVHFRIATHGKIIKECCHPFVVNKNLVFCHNGILSNEFGATKDGNFSDTMLFNKNILQELDKKDLEYMLKGKNLVLKRLLEGYIGNGNKMIFLDKNDNYCILNERLGVWDNGIWYSNTSYKRIKIQQITWNNWYDGDFYGNYWYNSPKYNSRNK